MYDELVRDSWSMIVYINIKIDVIMRFIDNQNVIWRESMMKIVVDRVIRGFIIVLNAIGSKEEKISGIIKIWVTHLELWRFLV
jgi:hypothetical protein